MSWPRVPVLPEPDEDIRILGVPVGRLFWLGPLFVLPLLFAALLMSLGAVAALPIALVFFLALYALFGLDLWRSTYWAMTWWLRPERRGKVVEVGSAPPSAAGPAAHPPAARAASLRSRLVSRLGEVRPAGEMGPEPGTLALVDPPAVEYTDPESLWRRWGDALRRAIRRGATVQVVTWVEPDWDAAMWERERRAVLRAGDGGLGDLAAQRWVLHRALSVAVGRRVVHGIRVVPGPGTPRDALADLARHCAAALAGAGNWVMPDRESRAQVCRRALDWAGWFTTIGGGTPELSALWRGWSVEDATGQVDRSPANSGYVDNSVDSDVNSEDVPDMRWDGEPAEAGEPLQDPDATETAADTGLASVEEPSDAGEAVAMRVSPDDEGEALSDTTAVRVGNTQNGGEPESGWDETKESANAAVGEKEMGDILASGPRFRFLGIPPLTAALPGLRPLRRRSDESSGEDERLNTPGHLDRPVRPLVAVWSPVPAGKTTVAAELAAALARGGVSVALLDLDTRSRALGGRLCVPRRTTVLSAAMAARPIAPLPDPVPVWPGVVAFVDAPDAPPAGEWSLWRLNRLLAAGAPDAEWWVADLPATGPLVPVVLEASWVVVLVADLDWSRVGEVRRAYREWTGAGKPVLVVVNRWVSDLPGLPHVQPSEVLGVEPAAVVPFDPSVYSAAVTGRPAAAGSQPVMAAMDELAMAVGRVVLAQ